MFFNSHTTNCSSISVFRACTYWIFSSSSASSSSVDRSSSSSFSFYLAKQSVGQPARLRLAEFSSEQSVSYILRLELLVESQLALV